MKLRKSTNNFMSFYDFWVKNERFEEMKDELISLKDNVPEIEDRFYKDLEFGTAGLRGKLGAGTNRMNMLTVARATQALAVIIEYDGELSKKRGVAIAYDSRHFSESFAKKAAQIFAGNGIKVYIFDSLRPTPELSFAIRHLGCISGIVITASHNPRDYNGYKVYWEDGTQISSETEEAIAIRMMVNPDFEGIYEIDFEEGKKQGLISVIGREIDDIYISKVKSLSLNSDVDKEIKIVYTPLNGAGNIPVRRVLRELGYKNVFVVPEQENPDPDFTTVKYPNPEDFWSFEYALRLGKEKNADILIATDPDCDRLAVLSRDEEDRFQMINGNQTGALLVHYILSSLREKGAIPPKGAIVKSIVTSDMGKVIADFYGVETVESLTGFKNICGVENEFEKTGEHIFIFGYEESIGYVYGTFVRDKDAVISSMLLVEAAAYYKKAGKTLHQALDDLYKKFGYYREKQISLVLGGIEGKNRIDRMMNHFRKSDFPSLAGKKALKKIDFLYQDEINVPHTDALKFVFEDLWYAIRPSGTEPKLKVYIYSRSDSLEESERLLDLSEKEIKENLYSVK